MNASKYNVAATAALVDELALAEARVKEICKELQARGVEHAEGIYYMLDIKTVEAKRVRYADLVKSIGVSRQKLAAYTSLRTERRWYIRAKDGSKAA
jgi:hypothetical protein